MFLKAVYIFNPVWTDETIATSQAYIQRLWWKKIILALQI